jgi:hypothetical protein
MTIPRATGIPQLKRNNIVQVSLGTSRSALDACLPVSSPTMPNSSSGMGESKQSKAAIVPANTQNSLLQEGLDFAVLGERVLVSPSPPSSLSVSIYENSSAVKGGESKGEDEK